MQGEDVDLGPWRAVVNDEAQYSIWPLAHELPAGWRDAGCEGTRAECLAWIAEVWTDMRPRRVRESAERRP
jgi:MbtH protein